MLFLEQHTNPGDGPHLLSHSEQWASQSPLQGTNPQQVLAPAGG
jgi:hypothetical protein